MAPNKVYLSLPVIVGLVSFVGKSSIASEELIFEYFFQI